MTVDRPQAYNRGLQNPPASAVVEVQETSAGSPGFFDKVDALHGLLIFVCVVFAGVSIWLQRRTRDWDSAYGVLKHDFNQIKSDLNRLQKQQNEEKRRLEDSRMQAAPRGETVVYRTPVEMASAASALGLVVQPKLAGVQNIVQILEPHIREVSRIPELENRLAEAREVLEAQRTADSAVGIIRAAGALLIRPELATEGLLRDLLHDLLRAQRRKGSVSLEDSRQLAGALARGCGVEFFVPEVGQPFDKNIHQPVGESITSAFREPVIKRVVSGGLREPQSGHIGMRADVEIG